MNQIRPSLPTRVLKCLRLALLALPMLTGCDSGTTNGTDDTIGLTQSVPGTLSAVVGGSRTTSISFNSSDGNLISAFVVTAGLDTLPTGWSGPQAFRCPTVSTANGCVLSLTFAPTATAEGSVTLSYSYVSNNGTAKSGSLSVPYISTTNNNVAVAQSPNGQIAAVVGASQPVSLTFTTDDGNAATALSLTTDLSALPSGWAADSQTFSCASVSTGSGCTLGLTYAPVSVGSGSFDLHYSFKDNSGTAKTGSITVPYAATTHNNVVGAASISGTVRTITGGSTSLNVTFTTDDGNPASNLALTTDLTALPTGWTSTASTFSCSAVNSGSACQLPLTFAPSSVGSGTLTLDFSYNDDSGTPKTGSVNIAYVATRPLHLYTTDWGTNSVSVCPIAADGSLGTCQTTGNGFNTPSGIAIHGNYAYIANYLNQSIGVCQVAADATLSNCVNSGGGIGYPQEIALNSTGTRIYVAGYGSYPSVCTIDVNGLLSACTNTTGAYDASWGVTLSSDDAFAFVASPYYGGVDVCTIAADGTFSACVPNGTGSGPFGVTVNGSKLYIGEIGPHSVVLCQPDGTGSLGACQTAGSGFDGPVAVAIGDQFAYVTNLYANTVSVCPLNADGTFGTCVVKADPSFNGIYGMTVH